MAGDRETPGEKNDKHKQTKVTSKAIEGKQKGF
jgi:hypothetical protein